jgi:hypothetical protein
MVVDMSEAAATERATPEAAAGGAVPERTLYCSFCYKSQHEVKKLISGPGGIFICDECVELCNEIIAVIFQARNPRLSRNCQPSVCWTAWGHRGDDARQGQSASASRRSSAVSSGELGRDWYRPGHFAPIGLGAVYMTVSSAGVKWFTALCRAGIIVAISDWRL